MEEPRERVDHAVEELDEAVAEAELAASERARRQVTGPPDVAPSTRPPAGNE